MTQKRDLQKETGDSSTGPINPKNVFLFAVLKPFITLHNMET